MQEDVSRLQQGREGKGRGREGTGPWRIQVSISLPEQVTIIP